MRSSDERIGRLVEADVTVSAQSEQLEIDTTSSRNRGLVTVTFPVEVSCPTVQGVRAPGIDIDARIQVLRHERAEAAAISVGEANELVEREAGHAREVHDACMMQPVELSIDRDRRLPCRESEDDVGSLVNRLCDATRDRNRRIFVTGKDSRLHAIRYTTG